MRSPKILSLVLWSLVCATAHASISPDNENSLVGGSQDLVGLAALIQAKTDYQRMLIEARVADATIQLQQAQASYDNAKTAQLTQLLGILQHEYSRILAEEHETDTRIARVKENEDRLSPLRLGKFSPGINQALTYFIQAVLTAEQIRDVMFKKVDPLGIENFVLNDPDDDETLSPFPGGNLGTLLQFMNKGGYSFAPWSPGHALILDLVSAIAKSGQDKLDQYHRYMDGIRSGTLPIWQLPLT